MSEDKDTQRVLVVDDDATIRAVVSEVLEIEGYEVKQAEDGAEAVEILLGWRPCLVLLDARMPVLDGRGVARALAAHGIQIPLVIVSAANEGARWAEETRAAAFLPKPFDLDQLVGVVRGLCPVPA